MSSGTPSEVSDLSMSDTESFADIQAMLYSPTSESASPSPPNKADGAPADRSPSEPSGPRHAKYYFDDGSVIFVVGGLSYRLHEYLFSRESPHWANIMAHRVPNEFFELDEDSVADFDAFLAVLYSTCYRQPDISTAIEWSAVLRLATKWSFADIRQLAIERLEPIASPIEKIALSHSHAIPGWLPAAYTSLCQRDSPLSAAEIRTVHAEDVALIMSVREALLRENAPLDASGVSARVACAMKLTGDATADSTSSELPSECGHPEKPPSTGLAAQATPEAERWAANSPDEFAFTPPLPPPMSPLSSGLPLDDVVDSKTSTGLPPATYGVYEGLISLMDAALMSSDDELGQVEEHIIHMINSAIDGHAAILQIIKSIFDKAGTSEALAYRLALICTELACHADWKVSPASLDDDPPKPISGAALFHAGLLDQCLAKIAAINANLRRPAGGSQLLPGALLWMFCLDQGISLQLNYLDHDIARGGTPTVQPEDFERDRHIIQFVGYLVLQRLLSEVELRKCLDQLVASLEGAARAEHSIQLLCELLLAAAPSQSWASLGGYATRVREGVRGLCEDSSTYTLAHEVLELQSYWVATMRGRGK